MVPVSGGFEMFELCHAGRVASMALRDGGMIMEAWAVTVHGKATRRSRIVIENIFTSYTIHRRIQQESVKLKVVILA